MTTPGPADPDPLVAIRLRAWARNRGRQQELAAAVDATRRSGTWDPDRLRTARAVTHQLIGSAGTFGHDGVSRAAHRIHDLLPRDPGPTGRDLDELSELVSEVGALLQHDPNPDED